MRNSAGQLTDRLKTLRLLQRSLGNLPSHDLGLKALGAAKIVNRQAEDGDACR